MYLANVCTVWDPLGIQQPICGLGGLGSEVLQVVSRPIQHRHCIASAANNASLASSILSYMPFLDVRNPFLRGSLLGNLPESGQRACRCRSNHLNIVMLSLISADGFPFPIVKSAETP
jgi:hypothetical protein